MRKGEGATMDFASDGELFVSSNTPDCWPSKSSFWAVTIKVFPARVRKTPALAAGGFFLIHHFLVSLIGRE